MIMHRNIIDYHNYFLFRYVRYDSTALTLFAC